MILKRLSIIFFGLNYKIQMSLQLNSILLFEGIVENVYCRVVKKKKNLFGKRNVYVLVTEPHNWQVERRLSDFKWLSERLRREFPKLTVRILI